MTTTTAPKISESDRAGSEELNNCEKCLICYIPCSGPVATYSSKNIWSPSPISSRLHVIFILRKLLELPNDILEKYLICLGDPVEKWVTLCSNCSAIVNQAEKVYYELVKIQRKFDSIKKIVIDKVKNSEEDETTINGARGDGVSRVIKRGRGRKKKVLPLLESLVTSSTLTAESRQFIKNNEYNLLFDAFMDGDMETPTQTHLARRPEKFSLKLPQVEGEVTYLFLPREEEDEKNDHSNPDLDDDEDVGGDMDSGDFGDPSSDIENDNEQTSKSSSSPLKPSETLSSQERSEEEDETSPGPDWSVKLECPYCESYQFQLTKGEQFCAHLELCHGLLGENKDKLLCCPICDQFTRTVDESIQFVEHLPICYGGKQDKMNWKVMVCDACPGPVKKYFKVDGFIQHYSYHKKNLFRCSLCPVRIPSRKNGRSHFEKMHPAFLDTFNEESSIIEDKTVPTLLWWCPVCPDTAFNEESLRDSHVQSEHPDYVSLSETSESETSRKCRFCSKVYSSPYDATLHEGTEHDSQLLYCRFCSKSFRTKAGLRTHVDHTHLKREASSKPLQFSCTLCTSSFSARSSLRDHIRKTHGQKYETSYVCKICGVCCQSNANLKRHLGQRHGIGDYDKHVCPYEGCKKVFWFRSCLKRHMTIHKGQPEFRCSFCFIGLYSKTGLKLHELRHINAESKPFQCQECGKRFAIMNSLQGHMKFHVKRPIEETRWTCPFCQKTFNTGHHKTRHLKKYCKGKRESKSVTSVESAERDET